MGGRSLNGVGSHDTGYSLPHRSTINFSGGVTGGRGRRSVVFIVAVAALVLLILFGIGSCVSSCVAVRQQQSDQTQQEQGTNQIDARVAQGASDSITTELTPALDSAQKLEAIARNADQYGDDRIIELALGEPAAIDFVYQYPSAEKTSQPYGGTIVKGTVPVLYDWDTRWGFVDYGGLPLGLTGSGPTSLAMAYMGLTGKSDRTPADIAALATSAGQASGDAGTTADFFTGSASNLGLACEKLDPTASNLVTNLDEKTKVLVQLQAGTATDAAHWALVVTTNQDGSVVLYDPTSTEATAHPWDAATIADSCDALYVLREDEDATTQDADADAQGQDATTQEDGDTTTSDAA